MWYHAGVVDADNFTTETSDLGTLTLPSVYACIVPFYMDNQGNQIYGKARILIESAPSNILSFGYDQLYFSREFANESTANFEVNGAISTSGVTVTVPTNNNWSVVGQYVQHIHHHYGMNYQRAHLFLLFLMFAQIQSKYYPVQHQLKYIH